MIFRRWRLIVPCVLLLICVTASYAPLVRSARADDDSATDVAKGDDSSAEVDEKAKLRQEREEELQLLTLFADTLDQISRNYVKDISRRELMEAAIEGMLTKLDQYSNYISPDQIDRFKGSVESEFGGIGIQVSVEGDELKVISPIVGSPAYRAGMIAGDVITEIAGESAAGITIDEAVRRMKGEVGTKVKVSVRHPDDTSETFDLNREIIRVQTVMGDRRTEGDRWNFFYDEEKKIGYIRLTAFGRHTVEELRAAMKELKSNDLHGLVLDLRYNPGGLLSVAIDVCDMFISKGRIVSTEGRNAPKRVWNAHRRGAMEGFPMAVLVNHYSASASEIVSACLQDHQRAVIIGERSWGKGSVQNIIELENGRSALKLTTAGYLRPSGENIHRFEGAQEDDVWGVSPDEGYEVKFSNRDSVRFLRYRRKRDIVHHETPPSGEENEEFEDLQLAKAIQYIDQQLSPLADNVAEDSPEKGKSTPDKPNDATPKDQGDSKPSKSDPSDSEKP